MVRELGLQRSLQDCFGELFQQAVLADDVFRLLVIGQQLINEGLVDSHRFLILLFRWSFTQLLLQLPLTNCGSQLKQSQTAQLLLALPCGKKKSVTSSPFPQSWERPVRSATLVCPGTQTSWAASSWP